MKTKFLVALALLLSCSAGAKELTLNQTVGFYDDKLVPAKIRNECTNLGNRFAESTATAVQASGWSVLKKGNLDTAAPGVNLKLIIVNAVSAGNAFIGHSKSVSIMAELYKDGKLIDTYEGERNSSGGFGAGFKGSCAVLERCVVTLGKDVSKWLSTKNI